MLTCDLNKYYVNSTNKIATLNYHLTINNEEATYKIM